MDAITQQKQELVRMIESVNNPEILDSIKNLLSESERDLMFWFTNKKFHRKKHWR